MKIKKIKVKYTECCDYKELYLDDKFIMEGDYYHDKIGDRIKGFLKGLEYCGWELPETIMDEEFDKCPHGCDG